MSHIVTIKTEIRDAIALAFACQRLGIVAPTQGSFRLFTSTVTGLGVQLQGWRFPVVCDMTTGKLHYDNFGGNWGEDQKLGQLLQAYAVEKAKIEARKQGHTVTEQTLADGSIKLTVSVGGAT